MTTEESYLTYHSDGAAAGFVGPDAVEFFRGAVLTSALELYAKAGILAHSQVPLPTMLVQATQISGKAYKRSRQGAAAAAEDVKKWALDLKATLPVRSEP